MTKTCNHTENCRVGMATHGSCSACLGAKLAALKVANAALQAENTKLKEIDAEVCGVNLDVIEENAALHIELAAARKRIEELDSLVKTDDTETWRR